MTVPGCLIFEWINLSFFFLYQSHENLCYFFQTWLLGYELSDTILVATESAVYFLVS
jgi:hypothetical protein